MPFTIHFSRAFSPLLLLLLSAEQSSLSSHSLIAHISSTKIFTHFWRTTQLTRKQNTRNLFGPELRPSHDNETLARAHANEGANCCAYQWMRTLHARLTLLIEVLSRLIAWRTLDYSFVILLIRSDPKSITSALLSLSNSQTWIAHSHFEPRLNAHCSTKYIEIKR